MMIIPERGTEKIKKEGKTERKRERRKKERKKEGKCAFLRTLIA